MKRHILLYAVILCSAGEVEAQTPDTNWIKTETAIDENGTTITDITYYNGLGLPWQTISVRASPNRYNTVKWITYDALLRDDATDYLPFEVTMVDENLLSDAFSEQRNFYEERYGPDYERSFTEKVYEASPLGRVRKQALPGYLKDREELYTEFDYRTNALDEVRRLAVGVNDELICEGCHDAGTLACTETTDPEGHIVQRFTDGQGRTLLSRTFDGDKPIDTYSVYDDYGRLRWVVTPEGGFLLSDSQTFEKTADFAKRYCYVYTYDDRGRMVEKQMPGREAEYMIYDADNRLAMSQDGNQRINDEWMIYHYDALGRMQAQYLIVDDLPQEIEHYWTRQLIQNLFNDRTPPLSYTKVDSTQLIRRYVYDAYPSEVRAAGLDFRPIEGLTATSGESFRYDNAKGSLTFEKLAVLANDTITGYHERAYYYDYKGRLIQTVERDAEDGILCSSQRYDFVGNVVAQRESYTRANGMVDDRIDRNYTYDDRGRLLCETAQVNGGEQAVVDYEYDALGRLIGKTLGEGADAVSEQSEYDIRNWLTAKTGDLFDMTLRYSYTGNIASWQWQHKDPTAGDGPQNRYAFTYDGLSRLTNTDQYVNGELNKQNVERCLSYDRNGNLLTMLRYCNGEEQSNMVYNYTGNQLSFYRSGAIVDLGDAGFEIKLKIGRRLHIHNANGNITKDWLRKLDISYNCLNLLEKTTKNDSIVAKYSYLVDGTKLSAAGADGCGLLFRGSFTYRTDAEANRVFESTPFGGGRIVGTDVGSVVRYFLTDHLGSVRVVAEDKNNVLERNDFYPFGLRHPIPAMPVSDNRNRFNGKEEQAFVDLPWIDYGARLYDSDRGRWLTSDPKAEDFINSSQYCFCGNNPISRIDVNGAEWYSYQEDYEDGDGKVRTRTSYKYVNGVLSDREMQEGGYTYLGVTYDTGDTYYSLSGAVIPYLTGSTIQSAERPQNIQKSQLRKNRITNRVINSLKFASGAGGTLATAVSIYDKPLTFGSKYIIINSGGTQIRNMNRIYTSTGRIASSVGGVFYGLSLITDATAMISGNQSGLQTVKNTTINTALFAIGTKSPQTALVIGVGLSIFTPVRPVWLENPGPMINAPDNTRIIKIPRIQ